MGLSSKTRSAPHLGPHAEMSPTGLTIYLTLPQRYMETHFRWLRLMVSLAVGEMERIKGRPRPVTRRCSCSTSLPASSAWR